MYLERDTSNNDIFRYLIGLIGRSFWVIQYTCASMQCPHRVKLSSSLNALNILSKRFFFPFFSVWNKCFQNWRVRQGSLSNYNFRVNTMMYTCILKCYKQNFNSTFYLHKANKLPFDILEYSGQPLKHQGGSSKFNPQKSKTFIIWVITIRDA